MTLFFGFFRRFNDLDFFLRRMEFDNIRRGLLLIVSAPPALLRSALHLMHRLCSWMNRLDSVDFAHWPSTDGGNNPLVLDKSSQAIHRLSVKLIHAGFTDFEHSSDFFEGKPFEVIEGDHKSLAFR